jgi:hypothetical protein
MAIADLTVPSPDIVQLLRQWLQVRKTPVASGWFHDNESQADSQVVQLTATIIGHGTAYFRKGCISVSVLKLAQKLNAGNAYALGSEYAKSLLSGEPEYARSLGVVSGRITA